MIQINSENDRAMNMVASSNLTIHKTGNFIQINSEK
jgi:hypothetical protein